MGLGGVAVTGPELVAGYSARGVLARLGFAVEHRLDSTDRDCVYVTLDVPDTDDEARPFRIWALHRFDASRGPAEVDRAVLAALVECLTHEAAECLLRDGAAVVYPHGRGRRVPA